MFTKIIDFPCDFQRLKNIKNLENYKHLFFQFHLYHLQHSLADLLDVLIKLLNFRSHKCIGILHLFTLILLLLAVNYELQYYSSSWEVFQSKSHQHLSSYYYTSKSSFEWFLLFSVIKTPGHLHSESPSQSRWIGIV